VCSDEGHGMGRGQDVQGAVRRTDWLNKEMMLFLNVKIVYAALQVGNRVQATGEEVGDRCGRTNGTVSKPSHISGGLHTANTCDPTGTQLALSQCSLSGSGTMACACGDTLQPHFHFSYRLKHTYSIQWIVKKSRLTLIRKV
jgi:hypothetical protein